MWTNISKPTGTGYTNINTAKPSYDEPTISYDDSSTFYDGISQAAWTDIAKPNDGASRLIIVGMATGLIAPPTYALQHSFSVTSWININKPT